MGGIGKTTLAQHIYSLNKQDFESSSFVEEIGIRYKQSRLELLKQLLRDILGGKKISISSVFEGTQKIEEILQMKKVLIVLDDIENQDQLCTLIGKKTHLTQSKIIITTRHRDIDAWLGFISWRCSVHELSFLNPLESLELLCLHAFGSKIPMEGFKDLAAQLAQYCGGNPLALKVLGSSLPTTDKDQHKRNSMIEMWVDRINSLESLKEGFNCEIQDVLQKSFDSLPFHSHKELFLDIACFFVDGSQDVATILGGELYAKFGITTLINRCLITVSPDTGELVMHQLLKDMARNIVCKESRDPAKRSRVWLDDESYHVLRKGDGSDTIEGLALNMLKVRQGMRSEESALKTSSLAKMDKLKLLRLDNVKLTGSYKNFPKLRWLCWHGCPLKTMPSGLMMSNLVALDMSYGRLEKFETPTVISSLKLLNLEGCYKLASICNLHRLPKLETLMLRFCHTLSHLCKSIRDLENLAKLYLTGCTKLWKTSSSKKYVYQLERLKALCIGGDIPEQALLFLPRSLIVLDVSYCHLACNNDVHVVFHAQSLFNLSLRGNAFKHLPNTIDLKMLRRLFLSSCPNLMSLPCIPSTLVELDVEGCESLKRITFQSGRFSLQRFKYRYCFKLSEIQGLFNLVPIAKIDKAKLGHMQWIKAYQDHKVDLDGDEITKGRNFCIQMLYEYGIMCTYLQGIKDENMMTYEYMSSSAVLSFCVPLHEKKHRIQGLNVSCLYRSSGSKDKDERVLLAKIRNTTKGLTWIYNPVVYCEPRVNEDVVWLSYWPIGSILEDNDEIHVDIIVDDGVLIVSECGASLVYMDDGEPVEEENCEINTMKGEEVIGGDLSEFEVTTGGFYLCRRDLFGSETSLWLKRWFGDNIHYPESQGWRKTRPLNDNLDSYMEVLVKLSYSNVSEISKILKAVSGLAFVDSLYVDREKRTLTVTGEVDPEALLRKVRKYDGQVVSLKHLPWKSYDYKH